MKKARVFGILASAVVAAGAVLPTTTVFAASSPVVEKTFYDGNGIVDVDFVGNVQYKNVKVTVKDSSGKSYTTSIYSMDNDDLEFRINNYKAGKTYTYTISGIRNRGQSTYTKVSDQVTIPTTNTAAIIEKTKYDGNGKVEVDFQSNVWYKNNVKVTVKDNTGKSYTARILDFDDDELDFRINNYKAGKTYTYTISGIRPVGATTYKKVTGKVTIPAAQKTTNITLAKAKSIALNHADLKASQVYFTEAKLDRDDGILIYELEFRRGRMEYSYEIKASNGKILDWEQEYDD